MTDPRTGQLRERLEAVEKRVSAACAAAGRRREDVRIVAVTKKFPVTDVAALAGLGMRDFGESTDAEASGKAAALPGLRWHFVGRLQRNKCRSVAAYADVVHSVDRPEVARALEAGARRAEREVEVMMQVSLDGDPGRGGARPADVPAVAEACAAALHLRLAGVMAMAPLHVPPDEAFGRLAEIVARLVPAHPELTSISAGMSADFEIALRHGATHLRLGTALLGHRTP